MKIPVVVVTRFTQQTEKGEDGGMDGGVEGGRGGLCSPAGWKPREDLAEIVGYLWLEEGRKVWMLFKQRQRKMGSVDLHPDLQISICGLKKS